MSAAPVSDKRHRIIPDGGYFGAIVRPANYEEVVRLAGRLAKDSHEANIDLCESVLIEDLKPKGKALTRSAKASIGLHVLRVSGDEATATVISPDELGDEAAKLFLSYEGKETLCVRVEDKHFERTDFVFIEPDPARFESYSQAKRKGGAIDTDRDFVRQHLIREMQDRLEVLEREAPLVIVVLAQELAKVGGVVFSAELGKA